MRRILTAIVICLVLIACKPQQDALASLPDATASEVQDVAAPPTPVTPTGETFKTPLPQGVLLQQPYNPRLDIAQENPNGLTGRRTEFEFLEGNASQAMAEFAESMSAAGFVSVNGPVAEGDVIRQVFKKPGYGTVFARAQAQGAEQNKDVDARGFLVAAWPSDSSAVPVAAE